MRHKIRAWDNIKNRMVGQQWLIPGDRFEVLRLSGARDKNDVDIGENDIVIFRDTKYIVFYNEVMLRWTILTFTFDELGYKKYGLIERFNYEMAKEMEVIGNIQQEENNAGKTE